MHDEGQFDRTAGGALIVAGVGVAMMMAHHPVAVHDAGERARNAFVHGALIALLGMASWGFAHMAVRRGLDRPAPLAGLIAWSIALFANIGAATINGFATPAIAARGNIGPDVFAFAWELNQALARLAVVATGLAYLLWAHGWMLRPSWWPRLVGVHGVIFGLVPIILLATGMSMNVAGATTIYSMHALWMALAGLYLWSGRFAADHALSASDGM
jgi:drug/metabolite transporter (DMT)-like permease